LRHYAKRSADGSFSESDQLIDSKDEPDHQGLCDLEQHYLLKAIHEDLDLTDHYADAINSLRIVLAADQSIREGKIIRL